MGVKIDSPKGVKLEPITDSVLGDIVRTSSKGRGLSIDMSQSLDDLSLDVPDEVLRVYVVQKARELTRDKTITIPALAWGGLGTKEEAAAMARVGAIFSKYRLQYWAFDVYEMIRKLFFTSLLFFILPDTAAQQGIGFLVLNLSLLIAVHIRPYTKDWLNVMLIFSSFVQALTLMYGIMVSLESNSGFLSTSPGVWALFIALNVAVPFFPLVWIVFNYSVARRYLYKGWDQLVVWFTYMDNLTPLQKAARGARRGSAQMDSLLDVDVYSKRRLSPLKGLQAAGVVAMPSPLRSGSDALDSFIGAKCPETATGRTASASGEGRNVDISACNVMGVTRSPLRSPVVLGPRNEASSGGGRRLKKELVRDVEEQRRASLSAEHPALEWDVAEQPVTDEPTSDTFEIFNVFVNVGEHYSSVDTVQSADVEDEGA